MSLLSGMLNGIVDTGIFSSNLYIAIEIIIIVLLGAGPLIYLYLVKVPKSTQTLIRGTGDIREDVTPDPAKKTHLWGYMDTKFVKENNSDYVTLTGNHYQIAGSVIPKLISFMTRIAKIDRSDLDSGPKEQELSNIYNKIFNLKKTRRDFLKQVFDNKQYSGKMFYDGLNIMRVSHGQTNGELVNFYYQEPKSSYLLENTVDAVFMPTTEQDVLDFMGDVVKYNDQKNNSHVICMMPRGGGTNVTKCLVVERNSDQKEIFISVDMTDFTGLISHDKVNNLATFKAGTTGKQLELELEKKGFMCGHEPDSVEFSTLGGWIATNASGMKRGRYGNIEDIVVSFNVVCPKYPDKVLTLGHSLRTSSGPDISKAIFGIEGSCVIILDATIKIKALPENKTYDSYVLPDWERGCDFLKEVRETGQLPASLRMVDNLQFQFGQALKPAKTWAKSAISTAQKYGLRLMKYDLEKICACTIVYEGSNDECGSIKKRLDKLVKKHGGISGGGENGKAGYNLTNAIAYIRDFANTMSIFGDTFETSVPWSHVKDAGHVITNCLVEKHNEMKKKHGDLLKGEIFVSYRITQLYESGVCMYFTYAYHCADYSILESVQPEIEKALKQGVNDADSSLSHHHGIGKLKKDRFKEIHPVVKDTVEGLRATFDPNDYVRSRNNYF